MFYLNRQEPKVGSNFNFLMLPSGNTLAYIYFSDLVLKPISQHPTYMPVYDDYNKTILLFAYSIQDNLAKQSLWNRRYRQTNLTKIGSYPLKKCGCPCWKTDLMFSELKSPDIGLCLSCIKITPF